jgi:DNA-binding HxlR family transcriptional regulator
MTQSMDAQGKDARALFDGWQRGNLMAPDCPSRPVIQHLTSRWGTLVMVALAMGPHRFAELRRRIRGISERMLAQTLQELEADGFVLRVAQAVVPPRVDYSLTPLGEKAAQHVVALASWVEESLPQIMAARQPRAAE